MTLSSYQSGCVNPKQFIGGSLWLCVNPLVRTTAECLVWRQAEKKGPNSHRCQFVFICVMHCFIVIVVYNKTMQQLGFGSLLLASYYFGVHSQYIFSYYQFRYKTTNLLFSYYRCSFSGGRGGGGWAGVTATAFPKLTLIKWTKNATFDDLTGVCPP